MINLFFNSPIELTIKSEDCSEADSNVFVIAIVFNVDEVVKILKYTIEGKI